MNILEEIKFLITLNKYTNKIKEAVKMNDGKTTVASVVAVLGLVMSFFHLDIAQIVHVAGQDVTISNALFVIGMLVWGWYTRDKKTTIVPIIIFVMFMGFAPAADAGTFSITSPMETAPVGFYFPSTSGDGKTTFAVGVAHTFGRITHSDVPKIMLDFDATVAKEVNEKKDALGGLGIKIGYNSPRPSDTGFMFIPSIGGCLLNNFKDFKTAKDIITNYRFAVYGSMILYKW